MPKQYLIGLSIGPVQDFIAAARRTRDLWFGSFVLSEVSKAAALAFQNAGAKLIFPAAGTNLQPNSEANVGNKLLVIVDCKNPEDTLQAAKTAAQNRWEELAYQSRQKQKFPIDESIWKNQVSDMLEFFGAWVFLEKEIDYSAMAEEGKGRKRLEQLLNARKNTRQFIANPVHGGAIPKSSLDGLRESVLPGNLTYWQKRTLGLSAGEELDCIGVVKRLGGDIDQFTPLSRLAADPWLKYLKGKQIDLSLIEETIGELLSADLRLVSRVNGNNQKYDFFPYDGQLLYDFRIQAELNNLHRSTDGTDQKTIGAINDAKKHLNRLQTLMTSEPFNTLPKPNPYMAILVADGDNMGALLDSMNLIEDHQSISARLAEFATKVPETIREFHGHCVYAGGDDVLALLPLDKAVACAHQLSDDFKTALQAIKNINKTNVPTLSVGLGVSHFMTPMGKQLDLARRAEQLAKSNDKPVNERKNALAILLQPRSGAQISFRERWDNDINPRALLNNWIKAYHEQLLPRGTGYALRETAIALDWCKDNNMIEKEASRIMERRRNADGSWVEHGLIAEICQRAGKIGLVHLANELIISQHFARATLFSDQPASIEE